MTALVCAIVSLSLGVAAIPIVSPASTEEQVFARVERTGDPRDREFFVFNTSQASVTIRHDGHAEVNVPNVKRRNFDLKLGGAGRIDRLYYLEFEQDLVLAYEMSDRVSGWGYIVRLDQKSFKTKWSTTMIGYNLGPGLVENSTSYFTSANSLLKLDLNSGSRLWEVDLDLQFSPAFAEFGTPVLKGDVVIFPESNRGRTIEVAKANGRILLVK